MRIPSPGFLLQALGQVIRRFPATMLCAFTGVVALFILDEDFADQEASMRTWMVCLLGLPLLTGLVAYSEARSWAGKHGWLLQSGGLLLLLGYWFCLHPDADGFQYRELPGYFALLLVVHLFVAVAPYLNERSVRDFWEYNKEIFANIVVGAAFTFILFAGLSLAIVAVDRLFDLDLREIIYIRLFYVLAGIFNTSYFLFHFPKSFSYAAEDRTYSAIFRNLCKYILIPIVGLYFLILYAYAFKIILDWSLPRGWVASLVSGFSVAGIFTYLLNFYLPEQDGSRFASLYRRFFWWILLPLTVLLFVAIGRRIDDYGVTESRYLVAQMGVWLALNCLYFLIAKRDNIKFIPISLALFALNWAFGPLSAKAVSERSQLSRMTHILKQSGRFQNGRMTPGAAPVSARESAQFESAVEFLVQRDRLEALTPMLPVPVDSLPEAPGYYGVSGKLRSWLGLGASEKEASDLKTVNVYSATPISAVDIRGFAYFEPIALNASSKTEFKEKGYYFQLSQNGKMLEWLMFDGSNARVLETFDLQPLMRLWYAERHADNSYSELDSSERQKDFTGKKGTLRLVIENGTAEKSDTGFSMQYLNGFVFTK